jgi:hypothetical protein
MIKLTNLLKEAQLQKIEASKIQKTLERVLGTKVNYDINSNDNYEFYINNAKFMIGIGDDSPKSEYAFSIYNDGATKILAKGNADSVNDLMKQILSVAKKHKNSLLQTESVNEESFTAINKDTGKVSVFKSKDSRDAAVKAGTHDKKEDDGEKEPKGGKPNMFSKDAGYDAPDSEKKSSTPKLDKDGDGGMSSDTSRSVEDYLNKELGLDGSADLNSGGAIEYNIPDSTDTLLIGDDEKDGKPFSVGLANEDGFDPDDTYKSFDNQKDAMAYAKELAQKLKDDKKDGTVKDSSGGRAGNPKVNKATRQKAKELGITPENLGKEEYELKMVQAAHEALTDSNFHSEARKLIAIMEDNPELAKNPSLDPNKPGLGEPGYDDWVKTTAWGSKYGDSSDETDELGRAASNEAGWDGKDALDGIAFELKMRGFKDLASKIQSVFGDEKNEGRIKLTDLLNEAMGPSKSTISKISDLLKKELNTSDVKVKKIPQGRVRTGYEIIPFGYAGGLYIDEDFGGVWQIYITNQQGFPVKNQWDIKQFEDDVEDEATALKAAVAVVKRFAKKHIMKKMK